MSAPTRAPWVRLVREPMSAEQHDERPRIKGPDDVVALVEARARQEAVEVFYVVPVDSQARPLVLHEMTRGLLNCSLVHPREVFRVAILAGASGVIVAHNHPSGDPTPSAEDRAVTRQLVEAGKLLDIPLYDHVIIGAGRNVSMASAGLL